MTAFAEEGTHPPTPDDGFDTDGGFDTAGDDRTIVSPHRPKSARHGSAPSAESGEDDTIRVARAPRAPGPPDPAVPADPDDTVRIDRSAAPAAPDAVVTDGSVHVDDVRTAYSPNPEELRAGYAARPAAPVVAHRSATPPRMAQPAFDGETLDRSIRGKARRRAVSLAAAVTFAVIAVGCLLTALVLSTLG